MTWYALADGEDHLDDARWPNQRSRLGATASRRKSALKPKVRASQPPRAGADPADQAQEGAGTEEIELLVEPNTINDAGSEDFMCDQLSGRRSA